MSLAACVAIFQNDQLLLTKREDFEVWCLPGGGVEDNESLAQSAIREAKEETGLDIHLTSMVGAYSRSYGNGVIHSILFAAVPIGGKLTPQPGEVIDMRYFDRGEIDALLLMADHAQRISDAFEGVGGSAAWWHECPSWPEQADTRHKLYDMRNQSGLSRSDFYLKYQGQIKIDEGTLEIENIKTNER